MLEEISKKDKQWRLIALKICGDKSLADDLVQDMYIKIHKLKPKKANKSYISYIIYHLFIDYIRKQNKNILNIDSIKNIIYECDSDLLEDRLKIDEALSELSFWDREILLNTHEQSLRSNEEELGITVSKLFYSKHKALDNLKNTETIKKWQN